MGRPKKYTRAQLREAVDNWIASITRVVPVTEKVDTGERNAHGRPIYREEPVINRLGEQVTRVEYIEPPRIGDLTKRLGISRSTWAEYGKDPKLAGIVEEVSERIRDYLDRELLTRPGKDLRGVEFALSANYGMKQKSELTVKTAAPKTIPLSERKAILERIAKQFAAPASKAEADEQ